MSKVRASFAERFGAALPLAVARAPGRVNLIGEHTDYNQGLVLPTPIGRYVEVAVRACPGQGVRLLAVDLDESFETELGNDLPADRPGWVPYVFGVIEELRQLGLVDGGVDLALGGTVPRGAGLSSSAALETATLLALEGAFGFTLEPIEAAKLCHRVEERWAGVRCGIMDQMASRLGQPGHGLLIDCRDLSFQQIPLPMAEHAWVIVDSGIHRRLTSSAFNQRRRDCETAVEQLASVHHEVHSLRDVDGAMLARHNNLLHPRVLRRCQHVVAENQRVREAEHCLASAALDRFGSLMTASHHSLRDLYQVSSASLDRLVDTALGVDGVLGSRLTGAGFGGATVTLTRRQAVPKLGERIGATLRKLGLSGEVFEAHPAIGAGLVAPGDR